MWFLKQHTFRFDIHRKMFAEHYSQRHNKKGFRNRLKTVAKLLHGDENVDKLSAAEGEGDQQTAIRTQLESIRIYTPWFMYVITVLQVLVTAAGIIITGTSRIGIRPTKLISGE